MIGAGLAGATCARALADAGWRVTVYDKSRGVGGRMATRRAVWTDAHGESHALHYDSGATGFGARSAPFRDWVDRGLAAGWLQRWAPRRAGGPGSARAPDDLIAVPDMPEACRRTLAGVPQRLGCQIGRIERIGSAWRLQADGEVVASGIHHLVLAVPARQAATLLVDVRPGWAEALDRCPMTPCWTLMATSDDVPMAWDRWDRAAASDAGPFARVVRNDRKPGRSAPPGAAVWVAQATAAWTMRHLEDDAEQVAQTLCEALQALVSPGAPMTWRHSTAHRWRYALPGAGAAADTPGRAECWYDSSQGLGLAGDHLAGAGVEAAYLSGRALAIEMQRWHSAQTEAQRRGTGVQR